MIIGSTEQLYKKFDEAIRGLIAFNSAGIAGVVALTSKSGLIMPLSLRIAGLFFLLGVFASTVAWVFSVPGEPKDEAQGLRDPVETEIKYMTIALYSAAGVFLIDVSITFFSV
jgi:hypothetical protein